MDTLLAFIRRTAGTGIVGRALALSAVLAGCGGSGSFEKLPAQSAANPGAEEAPRRPVALVLHASDPLAWPGGPDAPPSEGGPDAGVTHEGHHHHH